MIKRLLTRSQLLLAGGIFLLTTSSLGVRAQDLTSDQLDGVKARLAEGATHRCVSAVVVTGAG